MVGKMFLSGLTHALSSQVRIIMAVRAIAHLLAKFISKFWAPSRTSNFNFLYIFNVCN